MTWKIEITEPHSGELGEAIAHADHQFAMEEYSYEAGRILEVHVHSAEPGAEWHIFTDLGEGHRFKIPPKRYRKLAELSVA